MKPFVRVCVGMALIALMAYAGWAVTIEITYRKNMKAGPPRLTMRFSSRGGGGGDRGASSKLTPLPTQSQFWPSYGKISVCKIANYIDASWAARFPGKWTGWSSN
jgi:hypothetical protein